MSLFVLDTDTLVLFQEGHEEVCRRVLSLPIEQLAISVITVEEQLSGWYTLLRRAKSAEKLALAYQRLADAVSLLSLFRILSFTEPAIDRFQQLKTQKLGVKTYGPSHRGHHSGVCRHVGNAQPPRLSMCPQPRDGRLVRLIVSAL